MLTPEPAEPVWPIRGIVEGFYGPPWSHEERLDLLAFCRRHKLNTFVYAPKDDPFHRARWREPYPRAAARRLGELAQAAREHDVDFVWALAPGLSTTYSSPDDFAALVAKATQIWDAGVRRFALLWDDIPEEMVDAAGQARVTNRFLAEFLEPRGAERDLLVVPVEYAGNDRSPYRDTFAAELEPRCVVYWTGPSVVPSAIERADAEAAAMALGRSLVLWENYPVNDFDPDRLFLGPLLGHSPDLASAPLIGLTANPMEHAVASKLALATVADFAWSPAGYDPEQSFRAALRLYRDEVVEALRNLAGDAPKREGNALDVPALIERLRRGVDAATGAGLLEAAVY